VSGDKAVESLRLILEGETKRERVSRWHCVCARYKSVRAVQIRHLWWSEKQRGLATLARPKQPPPELGYHPWRDPRWQARGGFIREQVFFFKTSGNENYYTQVSICVEIAMHIFKRKMLVPGLDYLLCLSYFLVRRSKDVV